MHPSLPSPKRTRSQSTTKANLTMKETPVVDSLPPLPPSDFSIPKTATKKRKMASAPSLKNERKKQIVSTADGDGDGDNAASSAKKMREDAPITAMKDEKRLRQFRKKAPQTYMTKLLRATSQRMFVIERTRGGTDEVPEELIVMAGSTGNLYHITIGLLPSCTCPDNKNGNQCKHIVYVLHNVLKAPEHLQYQLAFVSSELREILSHAPPLLSSQQASTEHPDSSQSNKRKEISGDCPICFTEFEPGSDEIVWCKAACGNNIHKTCFEQWAKSQNSRTEVRCVFCRTPWQGEDVSMQQIEGSTQRNHEGYVNVAPQLGLSGQRDYSTYNEFWVRRGRWE